MKSEQEIPVKKTKKRHFKRFLALLIIAALLAVALFSCLGKGIATEDADSIAEQKSEDKDPQSLENSLLIEIQSGIIADIYSMVCSAVEYKLTEAGFSCAPGVATTIENENYESVGTYYYMENSNLFSSGDLKSVGFIEVAKDDRSFFDPSKEESMIVVDPILDEEQQDLVCTYTYDNIGSSHFVYKDKYVTYYQQTPMRVVYSVRDNDPQNYDLTIGSLYDYDNGMFLYDESVLTFDNEDHSAISTFTDVDYKKLEYDLQKMAQNQLENGYAVEQYDVVYISPEQIQEYLDGAEEDTFFGYSVSDLTENMGVGTALEYTEKGLQPANLGSEDLSNYNWKSFLTKVGIGCGIIIVGAVLAPVTGGTSFACALVTITKVAVTASLCAALGTMAFETAKGMKDGKTFEEAIHGCTYAGLDSFANTFLVTAAITAIGVDTGLIKPVACFAAGTTVAALDSNGNPIHKPIEEIRVGDRVLSYSENDGSKSYERVSEIYKHKAYSLTELRIAGETISTTPEHPFFEPSRQGWTCAGDLDSREYVQSSDFKAHRVDAVKTFDCNEAVDVYNFTVQNNHTYFIGKSEILVHNKCDKVISKMRRKGVKNAWKEEVKAVKNGTSRYNWTPEQIKELLETGKVAGYDGHHIIPVSQLRGTAKEYLIASADDIALIPYDIHHGLVHAHGNPIGDMKALVQCVPWAEEQLAILLAM